MILDKSKYLILTIFSLLAFSACEETITLDFDFESRLVINSFFDSGSPWAVEVSKSANILDDNSEIELIENARVIIYDENNIELYELFHIENGVYGREGYFPSSARTYNLKVEVDALVVTGKSYVPGVSKLKINNFEVIKENKDEGIEVDFQIEDKSNIEAYYLWEIVDLRNEDENPLISNGDKLSDALISSLESSDIDSDDKKREILGGGVFGDGTYSTVYNTLKGRSSGRNDVDTKIFINTESHNLTIDSNLDDFDDLVSSFDPAGDGDDPEGGGEVINESKNFELRVVTISKDLYEYYNSVEAARGIGNTSLLARYKIYYTNIDGGLGIFAGFSESIIRF